MASGISWFGGWGLDWTNYCPPNLHRSGSTRREPRSANVTNFYSSHWQLLGVVLVEHNLTDGRVEIFLHQTESATAEEVVAKLNEIGRDPPKGHGRYGGSYKTHCAATVEVADWSWIQQFWIEPCERAELAQAWARAQSRLRGSVYGTLPGWGAAEKSVAEVIRTIT